MRAIAYISTLIALAGCKAAPDMTIAPNEFCSLSSEAEFIALDKKPLTLNYGDYSVVLAKPAGWGMGPSKSGHSGEIVVTEGVIVKFHITATNRADYIKALSTSEITWDGTVTRCTSAELPPSVE